MQVEPPRAHVRGGRAATAFDAIRLSDARLAAAAAVAALALTSTGDVLVVAVLLAVVAADVVVGVATVGAALAVLARWGTTSLPGLAGGQAVVGAAGWTGPALAVVSSWLAAAAVAAASPSRWWAAIPFGLTAGLLVAGPATGGGGVTAFAVRLAGAVGGMAVCVAATRWPASPARRGAAAAAGAVAVLLALA